MEPADDTRRSAYELPRAMLRINDPSLHRTQIRVINTLRGHARVLSDEARIRLVERIGADMATTVELYIAHVAPIIIHFKADTLKHFLKDTCYRNCFEIHANNYRVDMESVRFMKLYDGTQAFERPKYGSINVLNAPGGNPNVACTYGDCYLELNESVRQRCTVTPRGERARDARIDGGAVIGVLDHLAHSIVNIRDIDRVARVACGAARHEDYDRQFEFDEVQIHGELRFDRDFSRVVIPRKHRGAYHAEAERFAATNGITLTWL